jgi:hypothetical protein
MSQQSPILDVDNPELVLTNLDLAKIAMAKAEEDSLKAKQELLISLKVETNLQKKQLENLERLKEEKQKKSVLTLLNGPVTIKSEHQPTVKPEEKGVNIKETFPLFCCFPYL